MNTKLTSLSILSSMLVMACTADQTPHVSKLPSHQEVKMEESLAHDAVMQSQVSMASSRMVSPKRKAMAMAQYEMVTQPYFAPPLPDFIPNDNNQFAKINSNAIMRVSEQPVSTFSIDVDTGSYSMVRKYLNRGELPPSDAVRIEEMINYFDYHYQQPLQTDAPFSVSTQVMQTPWNSNTQLVQIGLQGYLPEQERSPANLVFLMDVSGSMNAPDKLPLLKNAFKLLSKQLTKDDRISIVVYAGASGVVLKPTAGNKRSAILQAINDLRAGGSTNGAAGINLAYQLAEQEFIKGGVNRVILATDGDFNVGTVSQNALVDLIKRQKKKGIALTTLGFGQGNYNDHLMEQLADYGDGNYAYIDNLSEARKVLVGQISATLETIAKDVKIQIEWNPSQVAEYRLIGYENRLLNREDFNNDKVDAGEIGAGHSVTALYEITLRDNAHKSIDPLRYQTKKDAIKTPHNKELAFVKLRYKKAKQAESTRSLLISQAITQQSLTQNAFNQRDQQELLFAASVAAFAQKLRDGEQLNDFDYDDILKLARNAKGDDKHGYRGEFLKLVELAKSLDS